MRRGIFRRVAVAACALVAAAGIATPQAAATSSVPAQLSSTITGALSISHGVHINQGDEILGFRGPTWNTCTLGYIDRSARVGYTAAHCAIPGEPIFNTNSQLIGFVEASNYLQLGSGATDVATIRFLDSVTVGGNPHSGDQRVAVADVRPGDEVCSYGNRNKRVVCGAVAGIRGANIYSHLPGTGFGDSGGPAWIPGRGFIGVISGGDNHNSQGIFFERIASPDGL